MKFDKKWVVLLLAFVAFAWAMIASELLFPFYSNNHDEPVYVLQAQTLLEGRLTLPVNRFFDDFFTPWFVVNQGDRGIFKYTPIHAAGLALGQLLFGSMRATLGFVAAGNVVLLYCLSREFYLPKGVALLATFCFLFSPFFLIQSTTYLSYTTALLLYLCFAVFLLRGSRYHAPFLLVWAGLALGVAFFSRPFDALLWAIPFGLFFLKINWQKPNQLIGQSLWLALGFLPIFGLVLLYNASMTGHPLRFPFTLYESLDTFGFGYRRQHALDKPVLYDLSAAVEALLAHLFQLNLWVFGGSLLLGLALFQLIAHPLNRRRGLLLGLLLIFPLGFFFFWGPYNFTRWGAIGYLGPMYYLPLLVPVVILGAQALFNLSKRNPMIVRVLVVVMFMINGGLLLWHIAQNYAYTRENRAIYRPLTEQPLDNALIFVPPLQGPYLLHPFAYLGNTPTLDGPVIYALDRGKENFALLEVYPARIAYRFDYYGPYTEGTDDNPKTDLVRLERLRVDHFTQWLRVVNPTDRPYVFVEVRNNDQTETYLLDDSSVQGRTYEVEWTISPEKVEFKGAYQEHVSSLTALSPDQKLIVSVAFSDSPERSTERIFERRFTFRLTEDDQLEILVPSEAWYNPFWPTSEWLRKDIDQVMADR